MLGLRATILLAFCLYGIWYGTESDIRDKCNGSQPCLAASL